MIPVETVYGQQERFIAVICVLHRDLMSNRLGYVLRGRRGGAYALP